jgi:hypothetical protein
VDDVLQAEYDATVERGSSLIGRMLNGADYGTRHAAAREAVAWLDETDNLNGITHRLSSAGNFDEAQFLSDPMSPDSLTSRMFDAVGRSVQINPHEDLGLLMDGVDPVDAATIGGQMHRTGPLRTRPRHEEAPVVECRTCEAGRAQERREERERRRREEEERERREEEARRAARRDGTMDPTEIRSQDDVAAEGRYDGTVFRGDNRTPAEIAAAGGFAGPAPGTDASLREHMAAGRPASAWISTTKDPGIGTFYGHNPWAVGNSSQSWMAEGGYVYRMDGVGGVDVDAVFGGARGNQEVAFSNPISWSHVQAYARVEPQTNFPGYPSAPLVWVDNPAYAGQ